MNDQVDMGSQRKRYRIFDVNMLREWQMPVSTNLYLEDEAEEEEVVTWEKEHQQCDPAVGTELSSQQRAELKTLLAMCCAMSLDTRSWWSTTLRLVMPSQYEFIQCKLQIP